MSRAADPHLGTGLREIDPLRASAEAGENARRLSDANAQRAGAQPEQRRNHLLSSLTPDDLGLLAPHLGEVSLPRRYQLEHHDRACQHVYFLDEGLALVAGAAGSHGVGVGMIGREGLVGLSALSGEQRSHYDIFIQAPGRGRRVDVAAMIHCMGRSTGLRSCISRFAHAFTNQLAQTVLANARSQIGARLARWLLMMHDRIDGDDLHLTHGTLSDMLGVRRAGVTVAMKALLSEGAISAERGLVRIRNREQLEQAAQGTYGPVDRASADLRR